MMNAICEQVQFLYYIFGLLLATGSNALVGAQFWNAEIDNLWCCVELVCNVTFIQHSFPLLVVWLECTYVCVQANGSKSFSHSHVRVSGRLIDDRV